ncbi:MAG: hypothetical protein QM632_01055 [Micrococcaceae bacterium]
MNFWLTMFILAVSLFSMVACAVDAIRKRPPGDVSTFSLGLAWLGLLGHVILSIVLTTQGSHAVKSTAEFWAYLITVFLIPPAAVFWSLLERTAQSSWTLSGVNIVVIIMVLRMAELWYGTYLGAFTH